ncbi:DUF1772 domain-containing protein [Phytomonospora sp. NPDC050363]|uniref:DUF1772 domain-containing protein n=1 Tax=Phytomonospora sp. NPDC050363 TaxID=3155642 RepID=UPI0033CCE206
MRRFVPAARLVLLTGTGLFAGFLLTVLVLEQSLRRFGGAVYTQVRQVELIGLDGLATATLVPAALAALLLTAADLRAGSGRSRLTAGALAALLAIFVLTLVVNVPINTDQLGWDPLSPPADWAAVRDRWQTAHVVRTVLGALAFGLASLAGPSAKPPAARL